MGIKSKALAALAAFALISGIGSVAMAPANAASVKTAAGVACTTAKKQTKVGKTALVCKKNAKGKLVWTKVSAASLAPKTTTTTRSISILSAPTATATTPEPTPTSPSGYPVVIDPNAGGSNEVIYPEPADVEKPLATNAPAPTNLHIVSLGDHAVTLSFDGVANADLYGIYLRYGDSFSSKGLDASNLSAEFTDLAADWSYVACAYYFLNGAQSNRNCIDVHTTGTRPVEPVLVAGPSDIQLRATETTISASWNAVPGASWYSLCHVRVEAVQCGGYTMLSETSAIFQDGSVYAGWKYEISVTAVFADGTRSAESKAVITTLGSQPAPATKWAAPTNLRIVDLTPTSVTVAWDDPANSPVTVWSVVTRHETSYTAQGGYPDQHQFTSTAIWAGGGFEIIVSGYDQVSGKWTAEAKIGFFAPAAN